MTDTRRAIPSVDRLLGSAELAPVLERWPRELVVDAIQEQLRALRARLAAGDEVRPDVGAIAAGVERALESLERGSLLPVINATGVILHTNLGRAPLADAAVDAMLEVARGYSNLEYDVEAGRRGSRYTHCRELLRRLTGAEDALVVNNNAAALVLALNTVARGREAIVSRGELVEIGGAFRVPEIMARSRARLREVGATNRTHLEDYQGAVGERTGALLKVHRSNFTIQGYTAEVSVRELVPVAQAAGVPLIHDIGSGLLVDPARAGIPNEPTPDASLRDGAAIVTMSGDKLLGGPQCGIILGSAGLIERMRRNPLCRALRVDKLTLAALSATLRLHLDPERALREIPVLRMLTTDVSALAARAASFAERLTPIVPCALVNATSAVGGGAAPDAVLPTVLVRLETGRLDGAEVERRLRAGSPPVVARVVDERAAIDLRTVAPDQESTLIECIRAAVS